VDPPHPSQREIRPLDLQQTRRLLSCARQTDLEALYLLAVTAGLRQGELLGLAWKDVDLEKGLLKVRRTLITRTGGPRLDQPKTKKSRRTITLTSKTVSALKRHKQYGQGVVSAEDLVFCTRSGKPISPQNLTKQSFRPLLKKAGLPSIRFHDLRHTCATLLLAKGVHPRVVQDLLGHASVTLTLDTYSHVLPQMGSLVADAMEDVLEE
jgi:integrase